ncbi:hypothetical protein LXL04_008945 [Taraxacum kok-saghyz]
MRVYGTLADMTRPGESDMRVYVTLADMTPDAQALDDDCRHQRHCYSPLLPPSVIAVTIDKLVTETKYDIAIDQLLSLLLLGSCPKDDEDFMAFGRNITFAHMNINMLLYSHKYNNAYILMSRAYYNRYKATDLSLSPLKNTEKAKEAVASCRRSRPNLHFGLP